MLWTQHQKPTTLSVKLALLPPTFLKSSLAYVTEYVPRQFLHLYPTVEVETSAAVSLCLHAQSRPNSRTLPPFPCPLKQPGIVQGAPFKSSRSWASMQVLAILIQSQTWPHASPVFRPFFVMLRSLRQVHIFEMCHHILSF